MNKKKVFMIVSICILVLSIVGSTLAYYRLVLFDDLTVDTITHGLDYYITYNGGQNVDSATLEMVSNYEESSNSSTEVSFYKNDNTYDIYGHIYLDINSIGENTRNSDSLKYTVVNTTTGVVLSSGKLKDRIEGNRALIKSNIPLKTTEELFKIYIWLDINENVDTNMEGESLSLTVKAEATMKQIEDPINAVDYISSIYLNNNPSQATVANNGIYYYYANTVNMMNDGMNENHVWADGINTGNIRYYGVNPNNYIYFNCAAYPDTNCEVWRIIGVFKNVEVVQDDGTIIQKDLVKIIKNESIGSIAWDQDKNQDSNLITYSNNWETSSLNELLNGKYYNRDDITTLIYYSGGEGTITDNLNLLNIGLKNNETREKITNVNWYLGGYNTSIGLYSNNIYKYERTNEVGTTILNGNTFVTDGYIGIVYASDYSYSADLNVCNEALYDYNEINCFDTDWLFNMGEQWLVTHDTDDPYGAWYIYSTGYVNNYDHNYVFRVHNVHPVLYFDSDQNILYGDGSENNPYVLG